MAVLLVFLLDLNFSILSFIFTQAFFVSNALTAFLLISFILESEVRQVTSFETKQMTLLGEITVSEVRSIKIAHFKFSSPNLEISFEVESQKGIPGHQYEFLNLDHLMIKPEKKYNVILLVKKSFIKDKEIFRTFKPLKIEYYPLEDKFHSYKINRLS